MTTPGAECPFLASDHSIDSLELEKPLAFRVIDDGWMIHLRRGTNKISC